MAMQRTEPISKWDKIPLCYPAVISQKDATIVEIGPGRGDFLFQLARENPDAAIIGIELKSKRYFKLIDRVRKLGIGNVQLIQADGRHAIKSFGAASLREIHINFPDPWPKRKHTENRLLAAEFIKDCANALCEGGVLYFITDAGWYAEDVKALISAAVKEFEGIVIDKNDFYPTFFAQKWLKEGRGIFCQRWSKRASPCGKIASGAL